MSDEKPDLAAQVTAVQSQLSALEAKVAAIEEQLGKLQTEVDDGDIPFPASGAGP